MTLARSAACAALVLCASGSQAAIVHLVGDTVDFYYEDTMTSMLPFGELNVVGNSIFATPNNFYAEARNASGNDTTSALGTVTVVLKGGYDFDSVVVAQQGDYQLNGSGAAVSESATLYVTDSSNPLTTISTALVSSSAININDNQVHPWSSDASVDLSTSFWEGVTSVDLTLESILGASTTATGDFARIQNKFVGGGLVTIMTIPVPLPASIWLFASGFALLVRAGNRRL